MISSALKTTAICVCPLILMSISFLRPANILLSSAVPPIPVLVDFGFAEKYDKESRTAFQSNLAYGTPEVN